MARATYGGAELSSVRTQNMDVEAVRDPSGIDVTMMKVSLDLAFEWGPQATASANDQIRVLGAPPAPPDGLGLSIRTLKDTLSTDRLPFIYTVGPDRVFEAPGFGSDGNRLPCDPGNGPITGKLSIFNMIGEKSAQGRWKITFFVPLGDNDLLSNRWTVEAATNSAGFTTRTLNGRAVMRADAVDSDNPQIQNVDSFRKWFFCPVPWGFRRDKVRVLVDEAGVNAAYTCVDIQTANPLGATGAGIKAVKISGNATAGSQSKFSKREGQYALAAAAPMGIFNFSIFDSIPAFLDKARAYIQHDSINPLNTASCLVRVTAGQDVPKTQLVRLATAICLDRFPNARVIEAYATQGLGDTENEGRWVEVRLVYLGSAAVATATLYNILDFESQMNFSNDITPRFPNNPQSQMTFFGSTANNNPLYQNWNMPTGTRPSDPSGSRGNWIGALITQTLEDQGFPPFVAPDNEEVVPVPLI
jgi:hypothetical protein